MATTTTNAVSPTMGALRRTRTRFARRGLSTTPGSGGGLVLALLSAMAFGLSGPLGKPLMDAGWSPAAVTIGRVLFGALLLTPATLVLLRGKWGLVMQQKWPILAFGVLAVAGAQFCYFQAVTRIPAAVALLLEYMGVVLVVLIVWARTGRPPAPLTLAGMAVAVGGLVLVLDLESTGLDPLGVLWALAAAVGLATYFIAGSSVHKDVPGVAVAGLGMLVGGVTLLTAGALGLLSLSTSTAPSAIGSLAIPWWVGLALMGLLTAGVAYGTGTMATRRLGATVASFVGLTEVLFTALFGWLLLEQHLGPVQLLGGAVVLGGIVLVRLQEARELRAAVRRAEREAATTGATPARRGRNTQGAPEARESEPAPTA
ncbi:DMT family transporter [Kytococcus sedentarius]|uniref:EamA family transporter n=1 Tax=Kytococcus sedentarius TaxID=1276 RepID=UPI0035BBF059